MWPELYSFYFNGVENKSSEWGVSPWHWYFLAAIPKSVTCALPFAAIGGFYKKRKTSIFGLVDEVVVDLLGPVIIFVGIFSMLPHKELRFIMPALTLINVAGAYGLQKM
jgi:alpha-1,6-mannosyltransferase